MSTPTADRKTQPSLARPPALAPSVEPSGTAPPAQPTTAGKRFARNIAQRVLVLIGFGGVLAGVLLNAGLAAWNSERLILHNARVASTHQALAVLDAVLATLADAESGQRGFLRGGARRPDSFRLYHAAIARLTGLLGNLRDLCGSDPAHQEQLTVLERQVAHRFGGLGPAIPLPPDKGLDPALAFSPGDSEQLVAQIRATIAAVRRQAEAALRDHVRESEESALIIRCAGPAGAILSVVLLSLAYVLVRRETAVQDRAAEAVARHRELLHVTLLGIGDGVIATDALGRVTLMNPVAEALTGWSQSEAAGQGVTGVFTIINEQNGQPVESPVVRCLRQDGIVALPNPTLLVARDGAKRPIEDSAGPVRAGGQTVGVVLVFRDVTKAHQAEKERERLLTQERAAHTLAESARTRAEASEAQVVEASRCKDNFLALLGHELRNPLGPLRNAVAILGVAPDCDPTVRHAREMIDRQVHHLTRLIDELLDASRIANGKIQLMRERLDLAQVVRSTADEMRPALEGEGLTLEVETPTLPLWVEGDAVRLTQVVGNLLTNAQKFTDVGGRITVRVASDPCEVFHTERRCVTVAIRDTGAGIEPELLARLFVPFTQADRTLDRSRGGLGLGLALVKGLVALHGGQVRASSAGLGQGSEFAFCLPLAGEPPAPVEVQTPAAAGRRALKVLIIEDNRDAADSLGMVLQLTGGHDVAVAYSGPEGVDRAQSFCPDVILCDLGLPGLSGFEVASRLRATPATASVHLLAVSGYGRDEDQRMARAAGFDTLLVKPVDLDDLTRLLADRER